MAGSTSLAGRRLQLSRILVLSTTHMIEMSRGIGEDVPLSPIDILTRIAAPRNIRYTVWSHWLSRKSAAGDSLAPPCFARRYQHGAIDFSHSPRPWVEVTRQHEPAPHG